MRNINFFSNLYAISYIPALVCITPSTKRKLLFERKVIVRMGTRENQKKYDDKNNDNMASSIYSKVPIDQGGKHVI